MKEIQLSTIFVTHDIDEAITLSNRIYILSPKTKTIIREYKLSKDTEQDRTEIIGKFYQLKEEILAIL